MKELDLLSELVLAVHHGDRGRFDALLGPLRAWLVERANAALTGSHARLREILQTDDLVQDVLCSAYRDLFDAHVRSEGALKAWLERILHNRLIDHVRRHFRKGTPPISRSIDEVQSTPSGFEQVLAATLPGPGSSPSSAAARGEERDLAERVLAQLKPVHRRMIELVLVEGMKTTEAARLLGFAADSGRNQLLRALREARAALPGVLARNGQPRAGPAGKS